MYLFALFNNRIAYSLDELILGLENFYSLKNFFLIFCRGFVFRYLNNIKITEKIDSFRVLHHG